MSHERRWSEGVDRRVLGPFELKEPLARGGMGVVWRAVHTGERVPVAIKLMNTESDRARRAFRNEIQAMAGLHHPGVVMVFDHGSIPEAIDDLPAGSSFVAMEYASFGSLKSRTSAMPWTQIRGTLLSLLDALAHAHARGVIHRDLKPGNVLLAGPDDVRPGLKLADFGLARAIARTDALESVTGTPMYMAPEQLRSRWRDFGPWTDLYALGMLAWELTTGRAPFHGLALPTMINAHLHGRLPPFQPRVSVPQRFESWLLRMLQTEPEARYRRAADAAWELGQLGEPDETGAVAPRVAAVLSNPTLTLDDTMLLLATGDVLEEIEESAPAPSTAKPVAVRAPPLPPTWKRPEPPRAPVQLLGVGLGLFGLRTIPLVGRGSERDVLWNALLEAWKRRTPGLVCLHGSSGNGKSRLVQWISERAHEVGGAHVLKAVHSPDPTPLDGIAPMVERWLRCVGLDRAGVATRLEERMVREPRAEREALLALLRPPEESDDGVRLAGAEERYSAALGPILRAAAERPVIVWLDDIQWGDDALAFASFVMERAKGHAVLAVLTAQSEALAERPVASASLDALVTQEWASRVDVSALTVRKSQELVRVLLGFDSDLAERLADRVGGNPLFAIQLVDDWVSRGVLVPGPQGFELRDGVDVALPDSLHEVWAARLQRLVDGLPSSRASLEIAAALGQDVSTTEWQEICDAAGVHWDPRLLASMVEGRLATLTEAGFSFAHGMLRESIERLARAEGRWVHANEACVSGLSTGSPIPHARLGRHLFAARAWDASSTHLLAALSDRTGVDQRTVRELLLLLEEVLRRLGLHDDDPRWTELWLARCSHLIDMRRPDDADREARRAMSASKRHDWPLLRARSQKALADVARSRGRVNQTRAMYASAVLAFERLDAPQALCDTLESLAHTCIMAGALDEATPPLARATALAKTLNAQGSMSFCRRLEGDIARLQNRFEDARRCYEEAADIASRAGLRGYASGSLHGVAEMERLLGNLDEAEAIYRRVIEWDNARGDYGEIPRLNLSLCQIARHRYAEARAGLQRLIDRWTEAHKPGYVAVAHVSMVPAVAGLADWAAYDRHLREAERLCAETGMVDIDVALAAENAGDQALEAGHPQRARAAWELARSNWEQLGDETRADALRARITGL